MVKKLSKVLLCLMVAFSGMSFINAEETTPEIITAKGEQIAYLTGDDWGVGVSKTFHSVLFYFASLNSSFGKSALHN